MQQIHMATLRILVWVKVCRCVLVCAAEAHCDTESFSVCESVRASVSVCLGVCSMLVCERAIVCVRVHCVYSNVRCASTVYHRVLVCESAC